MHPRLIVGLVATVLALGQVDAAGDGGEALRGVLASADGSPRRVAGRFTDRPAASVSPGRLLETLRDLSSIQPHAGWRSSTTRGEAEAFDYVEQRLRALPNLQAAGLEIERVPFNTQEGIEFWETRLDLTVAGVEHEVPADGLLGSFDDLELTLLSDTDGAINDSDRDPVVVSGAPLVVRDPDVLMGLDREAVAGRVVVADYALFDYYLLGVTPMFERAYHVIEIAPEALVIVTSFSDVVGESHGTLLGDLSAFAGLPVRVPTVFVRLEDLGTAGVGSWDDLALVEAARVTLDVDVFVPGRSQDLIARVPGRDPSRAVILSAHLDSANSPGALDNGSGSAVLLEVAQVVDALALEPPVDLVLAWFGSHERGLYGSTHFAASHPELVDRTLAVLQVDCLSAPLVGVDATIDLWESSYGIFGDDRLALSDYLSTTAARAGITVVSRDFRPFFGDSSSFTSFGVPSASLSYLGVDSGVELHYGGHLHSPYDTVELAEREIVTLQRMTQVALAAALGVGADEPPLRVAPAPDRRALFLGSHTESPLMTPVGLPDLGMTLTWNGFEVDLVPYGRPVSAADLEGADLVVVLPVHDYPTPGFGDDLYDEAWSGAEADVVESYVDSGGLLVVTNSLNRFGWFNFGVENEDWGDANLLAERFGVEYLGRRLAGVYATVQGSHPLVEGLAQVQLSYGSGVTFSHVQGEVLARAINGPAISSVPHGAAGGEVVVLADLGILFEPSDDNLRFFDNLARYARQR